MGQNNELAAPNLQKKIYEEFGVNFSKSKVKRLRKKLGWVLTGTKCCQLIREPNSVKRLEFCLQCEEDEMFDNVIFTDECSVHMEKHAEFQTQVGTAKVQGSCETSLQSSCLGWDF